MNHERALGNDERSRVVAMSSIGILLSLAMGACGAPAEGQVGAEALPSGTHPDAVLGSVTGAATTTVSNTGQAVGVCSPLTCCFPQGSEWGDNPFEDSLRQLGCSTPQAYTERYGSTDWWMFSQCEASPALLALVAAYATVAPYESVVSTNECLYLQSVGSLQANQVFVQFDPTCTSCRASTK
jgi:hypothetical protein